MEFRAPRQSEQENTQNYCRKIQFVHRVKNICFYVKIIIDLSKVKNNIMLNKQQLGYSQQKQIQQAQNQAQNQSIRTEKQTQYELQRTQFHQQSNMLRKELRIQKKPKQYQQQNQQDENQCMFPPIVSRTMRNKLSKQDEKKQQRIPEIPCKNYQPPQDKDKKSLSQLPKIQIKIQLQENVNIYEYQNIPQRQNPSKELKTEVTKQHKCQKEQKKQLQFQPNKYVIQQQQKQKKIYEIALQKVCKFDQQSKSPSILFQDMQHTIAFQSKLYYQNYKIVLTQPIKSLNSQCTFRIDNLKYCVGFGVALKEVIAKHEYNYQSQGSNQLAHGLYIVTSQGYSWSHSQKQQDDILRSGFNQLYNGLAISVKVVGQQIKFSYKKGQFTLTLPNRVRSKYTVCFCAYLHQKEDSISIVN